MCFKQETDAKEVEQLKLLKGRFDPTLAAANRGWTFSNQTGQGLGRAPAE
jgi:hypothetical protein